MIQQFEELKGTLTRNRVSLPLQNVRCALLTTIPP